MKGPLHLDQYFRGLNHFVTKDEGFFPCYYIPSYISLTPKIYWLLSTSSYAVAQCLQRFNN